MSIKKKSKKAGSKKKAQRATSNVFAMFDQQQIQEFKEAFSMIDQDRDGFIKDTDLKDMFNSLGKEESNDYIVEMLDEASGPLNFTMFLTLMGEKLNGTDPEDMIRNAFASFDFEGKGVLNEEKLRPLLMGMGDRFTDDECDEMFRLANADDDGNFNYLDLVKTIKHGAKDD
ncbi:myosin regulatory light polypeptide 9-like [Stylophora pistillata]|uniref:Myosin regulatory light polypeptide 9 n=1 Tax=Stylophora pistillata TaxID=50429 RepID=A0A2B4SR45_STYPI|nr:myosin regulatory light polypeptide 9-like [Stylophora pistillata]PFX32361.1 Myosin regulatory light polypeptide 9 [Stylophora pistillata]